MRRGAQLLLRFRLVAWLLLYVPLLLIAAIVLLCKAWMAGDDQYEVIGIVVAVLALLCLVVVVGVASRLVCPVCVGRVFGGARCSLHRQARKVLGSTRLGMLFQTVLAIRNLRCRFCGEHFGTADEEPEKRGRNEIDELYAMQVKTGRRAPRPERLKRPPTDDIPKPKEQRRSRKGRVRKGRVSSLRRK